MVRPQPDRLVQVGQGLVGLPPQHARIPAVGPRVGVLGIDPQGDRVIGDRPRQVLQPGPPQGPVGVRPGVVRVEPNRLGRLLDGLLVAAELAPDPGPHRPGGGAGRVDPAGILGGLEAGVELLPAPGFLARPQCRGQGVGLLGGELLPLGRPGRIREHLSVLRPQGWLELPGGCPVRCGPVGVSHLFVKCRPQVEHAHVGRADRRRLVEIRQGLRVLPEAGVSCAAIHVGLVPLAIFE